jgi:hypothetical protein
MKLRYLLFLTICLSVNANSEVLVQKPRWVSIDFYEVENRLDTLEQAKLKYYCDSPSFRRLKPEVVEKLEVKDKYGGSDKRLEYQSDFVIDSGAACFVGNIQACETAKEYFLEYARSDAPKKKYQWQGGSGRTTSSLQYGMNTYFLSHAINFLSIYHYKVGFSEDEIDLLDRWIESKVRAFKKKHNDPSIYSKFGVHVRKSAQNHYVVSASSSMALGAWLGNDTLFKTGLLQWATTLETMRTDGSLPHEISRGSRAISYTGITLTKLIRLAEMARTQGIDLYNKTIDGKTFHHAVSFMLDAVEQPSIVFEYAKYNRDSGGSIPYDRQEAKSPSSGTYSWIKPYLLRFPDHSNSRRIKDIGTKEGYFASAYHRTMSADQHLNVKQKCFLQPTQ